MKNDYSVKELLLAFWEPVNPQKRAFTTFSIMVFISLCNIVPRILINLSKMLFSPTDLNFIITVGLVVLWCSAYWIKSFRPAANFLATVGLLVLFGRLLLEGTAKHGSFPWIFLSPFLIFFMLGKRTAIIISLFYTFAVVIILTFLPQFIDNPYPEGLKFNLMLSYIAVSMGFLSFQFSRDIVEKKLRDNNAQLNRTMQLLQNREEALIESEQKYRYLIERAHEGMVIVQDNVIRLINNFLAHLGDYKPEETIGKPFLSFIHPDEKDKILKNYQMRFEGKKVPATYETKLLKKDGSAIEVEIHGGIITYEGEPADLIFVRDISKRLAAERENKDLQEQLYQARKLEAIGQLAGGVAHDFNNILSGITNVAGLLREEAGQADVDPVQHAETILNAAKRASDLTDKLLAFARKGTYQLSPIDIHEAVQDVQTILEHTFDKNIRIICELKAEKHITKGDKSQLQNILLNIAFNSRDAMPEGGTFTITTESGPLPEKFFQNAMGASNAVGYCYIKISDTGCGIPAGLQDRIFEPFFTTKKESGGTGLGLASVYGAIQTHSGIIDLESSEGKGTILTIYLPLTEQAVAEKTPSPTRIIKGKDTILLIDDDELARKTLEQLLKRLGYTVYSYDGGLEALAFYKDHSQEIDLVILDLIMPGISGADCLKKLRIINPEVKVVISSGYAVENDAMQINELEVSAFLNKPFSMKQLSGILQEVINQS